ncbi:SUMF1/EgtB/PvdO family nonheme iron enzyme [Pantanalinema sp. GBBB05]|uniref:SUMF1/EgtB/PvdO family nonheme iron enzyme n=1 Tax=Pantanalinema sp. GBBB05 TaxID=2604139 RepID=UPI001D3089EC|nr:SUMF1/EgtB/PvdO family nonheme iron enzyme [Pantanalinema sp. GBBB05]
MANNWAVCIGINHYEYLSPKKQLKCAVRDAEQVYKYLCAEASFAPDNVLLCTDTSESLGRISTRPSRNNLIVLLTEEIQRAKGADNLWLFFSGHGVLGRDRHDYLLTCDGYPKRLEDTAISVDFVTRCLTDCRAKNIVLILDMCRDEYPDGSKSVTEVGTETLELSKQRGITTIFSCSQGEESYEILELGQGVFTYVLLEALKQYSTSKQIEQYLIRRTAEINSNYNRPKQTPVLRVEPGFKYEAPLLWSSNFRALNFLEGEIKSTELSLNSKNTRALEEQINQPINLPIISNTQIFNFEVISIDAQGREVARCLKQSQFLIEDLGDTEIEMVVIPGGEYLMGSSERKPSSNELPTHLVTVKPFLMSKYPITKAQWKAVSNLPQICQKLRKLPTRSGGANHPVIQVSWYEAIEFCNRLSKKTSYTYRLPTEAEWEYACRAKTTTPFHFGETITSEIANFDGNFPYHSEGKGINRGKPTQVNMFQFANPFGLFDLHGNVWEWCQDSWCENYENAPNNGEAQLDCKENPNRVIRGGSWVNEAYKCRSACRNFGDANHASDNTGFRIVRSLNL